MRQTVADKRSGKASLKLIPECHVKNWERESMPGKQQVQRPWVKNKFGELKKEKRERNCRKIRNKVREVKNVTRTGRKGWPTEGSERAL